MVRASDALDTQLLGLPSEERARLAELLLASLEPAMTTRRQEPVVPGAPADLEAVWAEEALRRLAEVREGGVRARPAREVFERLTDRFAR